MPKTKLGSLPKPYAKLTILLTGTVRVQGLTNSDVGKIIGKCDDVAGARLKHPGRLTLDELLKLGKKTGIPIDELRQAIQY